MKNNLKEFLQEGDYEIWYTKPGYRFYDYNELIKFKPNLIPTIDDLNKTHIYLGSIKANNLNDAYNMMQGEHWSPNGEAKSLIRSLGLSHTSMSVGDIIKNKKGAYFVDDMGFKLLKESKINMKKQELIILIENTVRKVLKAKQ